MATPFQEDGARNLTKQFWQIRHVTGTPPRLVAGEQLGRRAKAADHPAFCIQFGVNCLNG